jgi:hypothetical protein
VAGHSPNEAEKLVLGPGHLDMTSKRTSSADGSVEPAFDKDPCPGNFDSDGIQNAYNHLFTEHGIRAPFSKTRGTAEKKADSISVMATGQKSIVKVMKLDLHNPREQVIANTFIKRFDRDHFQRLLMNWIVARNYSFSIAEENELREIFDYLNPSVSVRDDNLTHTTIKDKVALAFKEHKQKVVEVLREAPGVIYISFDGWRSCNRHALYGVLFF